MDLSAAKMDLKLDPQTLRLLAGRCGTARQIQEDEFLLATQAIVQGRCTLSTIVRYIELMECRARQEAALFAWDALFPNLEFTIRRRSPIGGLGERFFLGVWERHRADESRSYDACSLALAYCRAIFGELARMIEQEALNSCDRCNGNGWYIVRSGDKHICHHERAMELAS